MTSPAPAKALRGRVVPYYVRILRLRTLRPNSWQRAALFEGSIVLAALTVLADLASAWLLLVLPLAVAAAVKFTDVVATGLAGGAAPWPTPEEPDPAGDPHR